MALINRSRHPVPARRGQKAVALAAGAILSLGIARASDAGLIATDPFLTVASPGANPANGEYNSGDIVSGVTGFQNPTIAGFTGSWLGNNGTASVPAWDADATGLNAGVPTYESGGRLRSSGIDDRTHRIHRLLAPYSPVNTYYMSLLTSAALADAGNDGFSGAGFTDGGPSQSPGDVTMPSFKGLMIGYLSNGANTDFVIRHEGPGGSMVNDVLVASVTGTLRYTVFRLDFNDDPSNPAGNSKITVWRNPSTLTSEGAASNASAPLEFRTFALGSNASITQFTAATVDYSKAVNVDEPRFGTTWLDATTGTAVPEPGSIAALALGGLWVFARRRRA